MGYVSCVDCSEVFYGNDYESHVSCISEDAKYMGKLYNEHGHKPSKQAQFLDVLLEHFKGVIPSVKDADLKWYMESLINCENIPRKKKGFVNFCKNSFGRNTPAKYIDRMWAEVELVIDK